MERSRGSELGLVAGASLVAGAIVVLLARLRVVLPEPEMDVALAKATVSATEPSRELLSTEPALAVDASSPCFVATDADAEADSARVDALVERLQTGPTVPVEWGSLRVAATDAVNGSPLPRLRLRVMSGTRVADRTTSFGVAEETFALTPGAYAVLVLSPGYEPLELPAVGIEAGKLLDLGVLALRPGSARVRGFVRGDASVLASLQVELVGDGRLPCGVVDPKWSLTSVAIQEAWTSEKPCSICGFAAKSSRVRIGTDGSYALSRLAAGPYALRLVRGDDATIGAVQRIELREGEVASVDLDAPSLRTIDVELVDVDGVSLARTWAERVRTDDVSDLVEVVSAPIDWTCTLRGSDEMRVVSCHTPLPAGFGTAVGFGGRKLGTRRKGVVDDRARKPDESLRPAVLVPELAAASIDCVVTEDGLVRFERVPASVREIELATEGFVAIARIVDAGEHVYAGARLVARDEAGSSVEETAPATFRELDTRRYR